MGNTCKKGMCVSTKQKEIVIAPKPNKKPALYGLDVDNINTIKKNNDDARPHRHTPEKRRSRKQVNHNSLPSKVVIKVPNLREYPFTPLTHSPNISARESLDLFDQEVQD